MVHQEAGSAEEVLEELVGHTRSEDAGALWRNLRLDWVRNWDQSCQTAVLLSRLQHTGRPPPSFLRSLNASALLVGSIFDMLLLLCLL